MIVKCKNCLPKEGVDIPDFTILEKSKLAEWTVRLPLHSIKYLIDNYNLSQRDAKYIITHLNKIYGQCTNCKFNNLDIEYINCPKCGALNLNWRKDDGTKM